MQTPIGRVVRFRALMAFVPCCVSLVLLSACSRQKSAQTTSAAPQASTASAKPPRLAMGGPVSPGLRHLRGDETTPEVARRAREILDANLSAPFGTEVPFEVDGLSYVGRIEEHYHEPGGSRRPWGRHRGITVYRVE
jgi:hypothetical protein